MTHSSRHFHRLTAVAATTMFLLCAGVSAAFAGPAPIEPEIAPPPESVGGSAGGGFDWMLTGGAVLLAVAVVGVIALLWHRAHATGRRLATR